MNDKCTDLDMEETAPLKNHYRHSVDAVFNERMLNLEENLP
jgi:hypothetical protein